MSSTALRNRLLRKIAKTPVVDCHSHTMNPDQYERHQWTLFNLIGYSARDFNAILGEDWAKVRERASSDGARWRIMRGVVERIRNTTYWRHQVVMYRELFGFTYEELSDRNWKKLDQTIRARMKEPGRYRRVTKGLCGIVTAVRNVTPFDERWDPDYFTPVLRMEIVLRLHARESAFAIDSPHPCLTYLERNTGASIGSLTKLKAAVRAMMSDYKRRGAVAVKFGHAYWRTLLHDDISDADAQKVLAKILRKRSLTEAGIKALQDWAFRFVVRTAGEMDLVVQIHTGCQTNWGHIPDSDPLLLLNVIRDNGNVRFDLFHAGYPYAREIGMLGKHYPNVWLNMCWTYLITLAGSRQFLDEWIDLVPGHRLLGFGSDVGAPDLIYGHLHLARECLADVLARKIERDHLSEECAFHLARRMLLDNPCELYGIKPPNPRKPG